MAHPILSSIIILSLVIYFVNSDTIKVETKGGNNWWYYVQVEPEGTRTDTTVKIESAGEPGVFITLESDGWAYGTPQLSAQLVLPLGIKLIRGDSEIYVPNLITNYEAGKIFDLDLDFDTTGTSTPVHTTSTPVDTTSTPTDTTSAPTGATSGPTAAPTVRPTRETGYGETFKIKTRGNSWWYAVEIVSPEWIKNGYYPLTSVSIKSAGDPGVFIPLTSHPWAFATEPLSRELVLPLSVKISRRSTHLSPIYLPDLITEFEVETLFDLCVTGWPSSHAVPTSAPIQPPSCAPSSAPIQAPTQPTQSP